MSTEDVPEGDWREVSERLITKNDALSPWGIGARNTGKEQEKLDRLREAHKEKWGELS